MALTNVARGPAGFGPVVGPSDGEGEHGRILRRVLSRGCVARSRCSRTLTSSICSHVRTTRRGGSDARGAICACFRSRLASRVVGSLVGVGNCAGGRTAGLLCDNKLGMCAARSSGVRGVLSRRCTSPSGCPSAIRCRLSCTLAIASPSKGRMGCDGRVLRLCFRGRSPSFSLLFSSPRSKRACMSGCGTDVLTGKDGILTRHIGFTPRPRSSVDIVSRRANCMGTLVNNHKRGATDLALGQTASAAERPNSAFGVISACTPTLGRGNVALTAAFRSRPCRCPSNSPMGGTAHSCGKAAAVHATVRGSVGIMTIGYLRGMAPSLKLGCLSGFNFAALTRKARTSGSTGNGM